MHLEVPGSMRFVPLIIKGGRFKEIWFRENILRRFIVWQKDLMRTKPFFTLDTL